MATFYQYTKEGNQIWSTATANLQAGTMDWLGNGFFIVNGPGNISLWKITDRGIAQIGVRIVTYTAAQSGGGIAYNHHRLHLDEANTTEEDLFNFDGQSFFYTFNELIGSPGVLNGFLAMRNVTGKNCSNIVFQANIDGVVAAEKGICWDGSYLYALVLTTSTPSTEKLRIYSIIGSTVTNINNPNVQNTTHEDICFDGYYFWCADSTGPTIRQYTVNKGTIKEVNNFTAPTGVTGITTDGTYLYIIGA
jgi:hypothetical protein